MSRFREKSKISTQLRLQVVRYDKRNMTSQHGQHSKPAAPILHCPSVFYRFLLVMDFACPGVVQYDKTNMTSQLVANMMVYPE